MLCILCRLSILTIALDICKSGYEDEWASEKVWTKRNILPMLESNPQSSSSLDTYYTDWIWKYVSTKEEQYVLRRTYPLIFLALFN